MPDFKIKAILFFLLTYLAGSILSYLGNTAQMEGTHMALIFKKRAQIFSNSTGSNIFDIKTRRAYSYEWWRYSEEIKGEVIFNSYKYSTATSKHQRDLLELFSTTPLTFVQCPGGLQNKKSGLVYYRLLIKELIMLIKKPGTHKATNEGRKQDINFYRSKMHTIRRLLEAEKDA